MSIPAKKRTAIDQWAIDTIGVAELAERLCVVNKSPIPEIHPTVLLEEAVQHVYLGGGPREEYSSARPALNRRTPDDDLLIPIDEVLANYDDRRQRIIIYVYNVRAAAARLNCPEKELLYVVRLHEYGHAMDHLGVSFADIHRYLNDSVTKPIRKSLSLVSRRFRRSSESEKEFWSQAMTWVALQKLPTAERTSSAFLELMKHQRPEYQLDWDLLTILTPASLQKVRRLWTDWNLPSPPEDATAREALTALLRAMGAEELDQVLELRASLAKLSTAISSPSTVPTFRGKSTNVPLLIARNGPLQIRINAEAKTHPRPHFHIHHKAGYSASYAIKDCELLAGSMPAKYEKPVCEWAQEHHSHLLRAWNDVNNGKLPQPLVLVV